MPNIVYYGLFFSPVESKKLYDPSKIGKTLSKIIPDPHVTFAFKPTKEQYPPAELYGKEFDVRVVGLGNDGNNQGYLVEIPDTLERYYHNPAPKHITLSVSPSGKPVDTKNLKFEYIEPFVVRGKMGYNTGSQTFFEI